MSHNLVNLYQDRVDLLTNMNFNKLMSSCTITNQEAPDGGPHELARIIFLQSYDRPISHKTRK